MERTPHLCDVLLGFIKDETIADVIFSSSTGNSSSKLNSSLSDEVAIKQYKGEVKKANTAAKATQSASVLAKFAKDPRSSIRRTVAANPYIDLATRRYLHDWGHKKNDSEILAGLMSGMPVKEALDAIPNMTLYRRDYPWLSLSEAVKNDGSAAAYQLAKDANHHELHQLVVSHLYGDKVEGFPYASYLEGLESTTVTALLVQTAKSMKTLNADFVKLCNKYESEIRNFTNYPIFSSLKFVEADAVSLVLESPLNYLWIGLSRTKVSPKVMHKLLDKKNPEVTLQLALQEHRPLTSLMAEKAAFVVGGAGRSSYAAANFLTNVRVSISSEAVVALLQGADKSTTERWLLGEFKHHQPRPGEVSSLFLDPKDAFNTSNMYRYRSQAVITIPEIAQRLLYTLPHVLEKSWAAETIDALGESFFDLVGNHQDLAAYLAQRFEAAFKTEVSLWETALSFMGAWSSGLTELIETSFLATGHTPPRIVESPSPLQVSCEQLTIDF